MRTITQSDELTIKYSEGELLNKEWIPVQLVSAKIAEAEQQSNVVYKTYRSKFYNSIASGKYNISVFAGIKCINVTDTMKRTASLNLKFIKG